MMGEGLLWMETSDRVERALLAIGAALLMTEGYSAERAVEQIQALWLAFSPPEGKQVDDER
jgi:hypothetical protein